MNSFYTLDEYLEHESWLLMTVISCITYYV
jgi:hypothetical protein